MANCATAISGQAGQRAAAARTLPPALGSGASDVHEASNETKAATAQVLCGTDHIEKAQESIAPLTGADGVAGRWNGLQLPAPQKIGMQSETPQRGLGKSPKLQRWRLAAFGKNEMAFLEEIFADGSSREVRLPDGEESRVHIPPEIVNKALSSPQLKHMHIAHTHPVERSALFSDSYT